MSSPLVGAFEQDFNNDDISRLKGKHEALLASREALGKGEKDGEDFIPLDGKVPDQQFTTVLAVSKAFHSLCFLW